MQRSYFLAAIKKVEFEDKKEYTIAILDFELLKSSV